MKTKSILAKTIAIAALSISGLVAVNTVKTNTAEAAVVQNDASVYSVHQATTVYNDYENGQATGQVLAANTNWKVIKTTYDVQGNKWYDLGKNQWVKVVATQAASVNNSADQNYTSQNSQANQTSQTQASSNQNNTAVNTAAVSSTNGSDGSAKEWIANQESGGSYSARNGQYVGKYQLSASYLNGDYSAANQERVANNYVTSRYGSWSAAKSFWEANGWY